MRALEKTSILSFSDLTSYIKQDMEEVNNIILSSLDSEEELICVILKNLLNSGGKRLRPVLTILCAKMFNYEGNKHLKLAAAVECLHNATLLHDDVIDESKLRRNSPTANQIWGNKMSILVGDFLLSQAFRLMVETESLKILKILSDASKIITEGEIIQLTSSKDVTLSKDSYLRIINAKTAELFSAASLVGAVISSASSRMQNLIADFGRNLGLAFQVSDDLMDYNVESNLGKNYGDDFFEGKVTLPIIYAYQKSGLENKQVIQGIFNKDTRSKEDFNLICSILKENNIVNLVKQEVIHFINQAKDSLFLLSHEYDVNMLEALLKLVEERI